MLFLFHLFVFISFLLLLLLLLFILFFYFILLFFILFLIKKIIYSYFYCTLLTCYFILYFCNTNFLLINNVLILKLSVIEDVVHEAHTVIAFYFCKIIGCTVVDVPLHGQCATM